MPSDSTLQNYYENLMQVILASNMRRLVHFAGITFKIDRPQPDDVYDTAYGSIARDTDPIRITPDGLGIINMSEYEFAPFAFDDAGQLEVGWLFCFTDLHVSDIITVERVENLQVEQYRIVDKTTFGASTEIINRYQIRPL